MEPAYLDVHRDAGDEAVPLAGGTTTLGREAVNTVSFPSDDGVSRRHAVVQRLSAGWRLRDLGSTNGTYVNKARLLADHMLCPGDEIRIGHSRMLFRVSDEEGTRPGRLIGTAALRLPESSTPGPAAPETVRESDAGEEWGGDRVPPPATLSHSADPRYPGDPLRSQGTGFPTASGAAPGAAGVAQAGGLGTPIHAGSAQGPVVLRPERGAGRVRGVARNIRLPDAAGTVFAFRVDSYDGSGNRGEPVPVEVRLFRSGQISDGEEVEASGNWSHGTLRADRVLNLTTGAPVRVWNLLGLRRIWRSRGLIATCGVALCLAAGSATALIVWHLTASPVREEPGDQVSATVVVPNVVGQDIGIASDSLQLLDLDRTVITEFSDTVPFGHVIRTDPGAGTSLHPGSRVIVVMAGPGSR